MSTHRDRGRALAREWSRLDAGVPLVLLPVRIETRFVDGALLIRIDPDVLHHDMHVGVLRSDEKALATVFWDGHRRRGQQRGGAQRGVAIAGRVARSVARRLGGARGEDRRRRRRRIAAARRSRGCCPARWQARAWFDGKSAVLGWSSKVRAPLRLGFDIDDPHWQDAQALDADEQAGRMRLDPQARWLTDFDEAEACGMAIRVALWPTSPS